MLLFPTTLLLLQYSLKLSGELICRRPWRYAEQPAAQSSWRVVIPSRLSSQPQPDIEHRHLTPATTPYFLSSKSSKGNGEAGRLVTKTGAVRGSKGVEEKERRCCSRLQPGRGFRNGPSSSICNPSFRSEERVTSGTWFGVTEVACRSGQKKQKRRPDQHFVGRCMRQRVHI